MNEVPSHITIDQRDDGLDVRGEIDAHTAPSLRDAALAQLESGSTTMSMAMDGVEFIDSSGLAVLVAMTTEARERGGDVIVLDPSPAVTRLFELTGLTEHMTLRSSD